MKKTTKIFTILGYIYVALPILIFFIGWCNPLTATLGSAIILLSLIFACKNAPEIWLPNNKKQILFVISVFLISLAWVYMSGIGALVFQNQDHNVRNSIFEMLAISRWPVEHMEQPAILTYYIAFWLPSAVIGKLFHSVQIGYYFQVIWATIGVFLFFYYVLAGLRKKNYLPIIIFIMFSGLDYVGAIVTFYANGINDPTSHMEWWASIFQYSSMTTQLFWVFNQAIATWLMVSMFCLEKNNKNIVFLYSCLFLHSTLPAIGMFPFIVYWMLKNGEKKVTLTTLKNAVKSAFSVQNIFGCIIALICITYLSANVSGGKTSHMHMSHNMLPFILWLLLFFVLEVGIYLGSVFQIYYKKVIYYITGICLLVYPVFTVGSSADFCMRASIPALVVLYLMICKAIESRYYCKKCETAFTILFLALCLGAATPMHEFSRTILNTGMGIIKQPYHIGFDNFYGWERDNKFLKYFGKNIKN